MTETILMSGKDILFILADRLASSNWLSTLNIVKDVSFLIIPRYDRRG